MIWRGESASARDVVVRISGCQVTMIRARGETSAVLRDGQHRRGYRKQSVLVKKSSTCWSEQMIMNDDCRLRVALQALHPSWQESLQLYGEQSKSMGGRGRSCCEMTLEPGKIRYFAPRPNILAFARPRKSKLYLHTYTSPGNVSLSSCVRLYYVSEHHALLHRAPTALGLELQC